MSWDLQRKPSQTLDISGFSCRIAWVTLQCGTWIGKRAWQWSPWYQIFSALCEIPFRIVRAALYSPIFIRLLVCLAVNCHPTQFFGFHQKNWKFYIRKWLCCFWTSGSRVIRRNKTEQKIQIRSKNQISNRYAECLGTDWDGVVSLRIKSNFE